MTFTKEQLEALTLFVHPVATASMPKGCRTVPLSPKEFHANMV